jgi:hypothetical protein
MAHLSDGLTESTSHQRQALSCLAFRWSTRRSRLVRQLEVAARLARACLRTR